MHPDRKTEMLIKRILSIPPATKFPRCPARSQAKAKRLEADGDDSHYGKGHVCELCRCNHVAGWGTGGKTKEYDFYNIGRPDVGHYGCGFCRDHEHGCRTQWAHSYAINHMKALQQFGMDKHPSIDFRNVALVEAEEAGARQEIRKGMVLVQDALKDFQQKIVEKNVTVLFKGEHVQASDADIIPLACELARTISKLSVDTYKLEESDYIHIDEVKLRIPRMIQLFERYCVSDDQRKDFLQGLKDIWTDVKTGSR